MENLFKQKRAANELLALTGIRGVAALFVVLSHINLFFIWAFHSNKYIYAQPFVDIFFVLSGFVISLVYIKKFSFARDFFYKFYSARFARIYPLYFVALFISGVIIVAHKGITSKESLDLIGAEGLIKQLSLLNAMPVFNSKMLVFTSWSVSIEWWLYILLFPILMALNGVRKVLAHPFVIVLIISLLMIYLYQPSIADSVMISWPAFIRGVVGFTLGWLTHWHFVNSSRLSSFCGKYCDVFMITTIVIIFGMPLFVKNQPWISLFFFPFLILGLCYKKSTSSKVLSSTFFVVLGDISYSVYLLHPVILDFCNKLIKKLFFLDKGLVIIIHTIIVLTVTLIVSYGSYLVIEGPARSSIYKFLTKKSIYRSKSVNVLK